MDLNKLESDWRAQYLILESEYNKLKFSVDEENSLFEGMSIAIESGNTSEMLRILTKLGNLCSKLSILAGRCQLQSSTFSDWAKVAAVPQLRIRCISFMGLYDSLRSECLQMQSAQSDCLDKLHRKMLEWELRNLLSEREINEAVQKWNPRFELAIKNKEESLAKQIALRLEVLKDKLSKLNLN